jgi:uncharacterized membrane protein
MLLAITTTIYVIASPKESEHLSEFFILGENQMAAGYPDELITGLQCPMFIGMGNHEYRNMSSTIETRATLTEFDNVTTRHEYSVMDPLDRQSLALSHNETIVIPHTLPLNKTASNRIGSVIQREHPGTGDERQ